MLSGQKTRFERWLRFPSHRTVASFGCKDIQLLRTWRRGAEGEVEHGQVSFYRRAWTMMPGVTKAGRNSYRAVGSCDTRAPPPTEEQTSGDTWADCASPAPHSTKLMGNHKLYPIRDVPSLQGSACVLAPFVPSSCNSV